MNKADCLKASMVAGVAKTAAIERLSLYVACFGAKSELAQSAQKELTDAIFAESEWKRIAEWNPQRRMKAIRDKELPLRLFSFSAMSR